jgi:hypothetical protein
MISLLIFFSGRKKLNQSDYLIFPLFEIMMLALKPDFFSFQPCLTTITDEVKTSLPKKDRKTTCC